MNIRRAPPSRAFVTPEPHQPPRRDPSVRRERPAPVSPPALIRRSLQGHLDRGFRPDIEGLRAVAVVAVILYHAKFLGVSGGFVGVDVFFVVSGFLITRLVLGEVASTGTISLLNFWGRRARRLLPAAAVTVIVTVLFARQMLSPLGLRSLASDTVGAGTFSANFVFAHRLGDYFGNQLGTSSPSPLLHFWSLAVEEQFYFCWPPLLLLLTRRPAQYRRLLLATIGILATLSFLAGLWMTSNKPAWAFYLLPSRMGELLAGAALAAAGTAVASVPVTWRAALGWAGLLGIAVACVWFDESIPWPGSAVLLPVVATMAVIVAGMSATGAAVTWAPSRVLAARPLQWIGRHSYALYLWHWPAFVLAEARYGPLSWPQRVVLIWIAVALSALSVQVLEDPVRHSRYLSAISVRSLALGAAMCIVVISVGWNLRSSGGELDGGVEAAAPQLDLSNTASVPGVSIVIGPTTPSAVTRPVMPSVPATVTETTLASPDPPSGSLAQLVASTQRALNNATGAAPVPSNLNPSLATARNRSQPYNDGCVNIGANSKLQPCEYGVAGADRTILLYGDSHAVQWFEPLQQIAFERGFRLVLLIKLGCPVAEVDVPTPVLHYTCPPYRDAAMAWIERNEPDLVVVGNAYTQYPAEAEEWAEGTVTSVERIVDISSNVVLIGDNPAWVVDVPECLSANLDDASECAISRDDAVRADRISAEVVAARDNDVTFVDTTDWFCTDDSCPPIVGNVLVMRDETHVTVPMAEFLKPVLEAALDPALDAA